MPIFTRRVRVARAEAITRGEDSTERSFWKWISASHTASKPKSSAACICASDSSKAVDSGMPVGHWNSVKSPVSIPILLEALTILAQPAIDDLVEQEPRAYTRRATA